jgi:hypothetical protein
MATRNPYGAKLAKQCLGKNAGPNIGDESDGQVAELNRFNPIQRPSSFGNLVQINLFNMGMTCSTQSRPSAIASFAW